ncbi:MAG: hypothetical protein IPM29_03700 [Planctomycetes bacterium]|nr:hypothetical protein [Planctomycetota bacterium]
MVSASTSRTPLLAVLLVLIACGAVAGWVWRAGGRGPADDRLPVASGPARVPVAMPGREASPSVGIETVAGLGDGSARADGTVASAAPHDPATGAAGRQPGAAGPAWPTGRRAGGGRRGGAVPSGEPAVAADLAFRALQYVGVDPEAERTWRRAIDDPSMPAGVRSDLIEDLNQEGYLDNSHPTREDLPLILARMQLIERLAPYAMDEVNAAAFEEAYKDLLDMYLRLGGESPR